MSLVIDSGFNYDADASAYIDAVEAADGQALETATRYAVNNFVIGCKQDGIWSAIKASCILAGARTLAGCLVPLVGAAPTNNNFVAGDYNRKTGLVGNGSSKYLNSNRASNSDPQNSYHLAIYATSARVNPGIYIGGENVSRNSIYANTSTIVVPLRTALAPDTGKSATATTGLIAATRTSSTNITWRAGFTSGNLTAGSNAPETTNVYVFARNAGGSLSLPIDARLSFYSIGESLDLAKLDDRVTDLMNAFAAAIP